MLVIIGISTLRAIRARVFLVIQRCAHVCIRVTRDVPFANVCVSASVYVRPTDRDRLRFLILDAGCGSGVFASRLLHFCLRRSCADCAYGPRKLGVSDGVSKDVAHEHWLASTHRLEVIVCVHPGLLKQRANSYAVVVADATEHACE